MTALLNEDGTASMATAIMSSHHGFRRDLACFVEALASGGSAHVSRMPLVADEWQKFHAKLHEHHSVEDAGLFPELRSRHPEIAAELDVLQAQHARIDPLLAQGDAQFSELRTEEALAVVRELQRLLAEHLELEERVAIPHLRGARDFPPLPSEEVAAGYAEGFAWSMGGLAPDVVAALEAMLPAALVAKLPEARRAFSERCVRVWGHDHAPVGR